MPCRLTVSHFLEHTTARVARRVGRLALLGKCTLKRFALGEKLTRLVLKRVGEPIELRRELGRRCKGGLTHVVQCGAEVLALLFHPRIRASSLRFDRLSFAHFGMRECLAKGARLFAAQGRIVGRRAAHRRHVGIGDEQHGAQREDCGLLREVLGGRELEGAPRLRQLPLERLILPLRLRLHCLDVLVGERLGRAGYVLRLLQARLVQRELLGRGRRLRHALGDRLSEPLLARSLAHLEPRLALMELRRELSIGQARFLQVGARERLGLARRGHANLRLGGRRLRLGCYSSRLRHRQPGALHLIPALFPLPLRRMQAFLPGRLGHREQLVQLLNLLRIAP